MSVKVGINGFGRIGRLVFRAALKEDDIQIVAVNDITDATTLAHLLKYDSVHGVMPQDVTVGDHQFNVAGKTIKVIAERDPGNLPWDEPEFSRRMLREHPTQFSCATQKHVVNYAAACSNAPASFETKKKPANILTPAPKKS